MAIGCHHRACWCLHPLAQNPPCCRGAFGMRVLGVGEASCHVEEPLRAARGAPVRRSPHHNSRQGWYSPSGGPHTRRPLAVFCPPPGSVPELEAALEGHGPCTTCDGL